MNIQENYSLKPYNTFGIDASARYFTEVTSIEALRKVLSSPKFTAVPRLILGGGSNILFASDFNGIVIRIDFRGIDLIKEDNEFYYVKAKAGENWHQFVCHCIKQGYAGIENLSLIPGNIGAAPMQNIGAYGVELKDVFHELEAFHMDTGECRTFSKEECKFDYRSSVFKNELKNQYIITSVTLRLTKKPVFNISYGAIEEELEQMGVKELSIAAIGEAVCSIRRSKLPDPKTIGNAGSFFKNPIVKIIQFNKLRKKFPDIAAYPLSGNEVKIAAGWLIEKSGWKGKKLGEYGVHDKQALVLVNFGKAKGKDIYGLAENIVSSVKKKFGIQLEREVNVIETGNI